MANADHLDQLRQGVEIWNAWRAAQPSVRPDLTLAELTQANLTGADLTWVNLAGASLVQAELTQANLTGADLTWVNLAGASLVDTNLTMAKLTGANLIGAKVTGAKLIQTDLTFANLVQANLADAKTSLIRCRVYGTSAWSLKLEGAKQQGLIITAEGEPEITIDNIEIAQFVYALLHNGKIRDVIDTITSKAVLILGRFREERKIVLDALRDELPKRDLIPIVFDFLTPANRDVTETIKVLAGLARFVIADVTDATEVRVELHNIVPDFTKLPVRPILLRGHGEFVSLRHLQSFPWVLPTFEYDSQEQLIACLDEVIRPAEAKVLELRGPQPG